MDYLGLQRPRLARLLAYRTLLRCLVLKEIKVRSRGTYLGTAWTLVNPLITILTYAVVFRQIFRVAIPNFLGFFLIGVLMWVFFSRVLTAATTVVVDAASLVKTSPFPLEILPLALVAYHLFHHLIALGLAVPLMFVMGSAQLGWSILLGGLILACFVVFTTAAALWCATIGVFFRDARDILEVALPVVFWATPILYAPEMVPEGLRELIQGNPLTSFMSAARAAVVDGQVPAASHLLFTAGWTAGLLLSGVWVFARCAPRFAEEI
jgi:ABC-type polysaccharide/polyol phosphate export permease